MYKFAKSQGSKRFHLSWSPAIPNLSAPNLKQSHCVAALLPLCSPSLAKDCYQTTVVGSITSSCCLSSAEAPRYLTNTSISNWLPLTFKLSIHFWPPYQHQIVETVIHSPCFYILNSYSLPNSKILAPVFTILMKLYFKVCKDLSQQITKFHGMISGFSLPDFWAFHTWTSLLEALNSCPPSSHCYLLIRPSPLNPSLLAFPLSLPGGSSGDGFSPLIPLTL